MNEKYYAARDAMEMDIAGNHYCRHVSAMTREGLHSKADIAAELGWRDWQIAKLQEQLETAKSLAGIAGDLNGVVQEGFAEVVSERDALQEQVQKLTDRLNRSEDYSIGIDMERMEFLEQVQKLAAENSAIKSAFKAVHSSTEEAELYGDVKYMVEPSEYEALADAVEETPATDAVIREIGAKAVDAFGIYHNFSDKRLIQVEARNYAVKLRAGVVS